MSLKGPNLLRESAMLQEQRALWTEYAENRYGGEENVPVYDSFDLFLCRKVSEAEERAGAQLLISQKRAGQRNAALVLCAALFLSTLFFAIGPTSAEMPQQAERTVADGAQEINYIASRNSDKYHLPGCEYAENILPENKVCINSKLDLAIAENKGYTPCSVCRP